MIVTERLILRPAEPRDSARLLVVREGVLDDRVVRDLPDFLQPGDALVFNDTRVIPAQLEGRRGGSAEGGRGGAGVHRNRHIRVPGSALRLGSRRRRSPTC